VLRLNSPEHCEIALALSGGGTRAVLFHLGVLSCLAEKIS
jgi:predicted acylesterase/phospholipase RssA